MSARTSAMAWMMLIAVALATTLSHAAVPNVVATQQWSTRYSAKQPNGYVIPVLYQQRDKPQIALMQANDGHGGKLCGIVAESGELVWCTHDGAAPGDIPPAISLPAVDDGSQGLAAFWQSFSAIGVPSVLIVVDAYGGSQQWNASSSLFEYSWDGGNPGPAFGGGFLFATGADTLHVLDAASGQPVWSNPSFEGTMAGNFQTLTSATATGGTRKLIFVPWMLDWTKCGLVMYDYTNLTVGGGSVQQVWRFTQANISLPRTFSCPTSSVVSADGATLIMWASNTLAPQFFIALDVLTGKQTLPIVNLTSPSAVIAAPSGYIVTYNGNDGPAVFYHMIPPVLAWNASTHPATRGLGQFQCDANNGNRGPARVMCTATPSSSSSTAGSRLLGWDVASGELLFTHALGTLVKAGPPKLDEDGASVYLTTTDGANLSGATNLTKFSITPGSATTTIRVDEYPVLNCTGMPTRVTYASGCTASGPSASVLRYCAGGAMRVQWFSSSATCDAMPKTAQSAPVGQCENSPGGTSFEVVLCE